MRVDGTTGGGGGGVGARILATLYFAWEASVTSVKERVSVISVFKEAKDLGLWIVANGGEGEVTDSKIVSLSACFLRILE